MLKLLTFLAPLLKRVLSTNKFTSAGGLLALLAVVLLKLHDIDTDTFKYMIGSSIGLIGLASKDGVRSDAKVAPEDVPPFPTLPANGAAVVLLLFALGLFSGCSSIFFKEPPVVDAANKAHLAVILGHHYGSAVQPKLPPVVAMPVSISVVAAPDSIDLPPALASVPEAPYLVQPPAGLSKRELRKWRRAQRRAMVEASRTVPAKVKVRKGAAYNAAPDGTAVAQRNIDAPVAIGPQATATDKSTRLPELTLWEKCAAWLDKGLKYLVLLLAAVFVGFLIYLRFSAFGRGVRSAASLARSAINQAGT